MIRLRAAASLASVVLVLVSAGCRSARTNQSVAIAQEPTANIVQTGGEKSALAETQLSISHLMQVAELLTIQHQYGQAAGIYQTILQREPGNKTAQQRLQKLPISNLPQQYGQPFPTPPAGSPVSTPPVAPPAIDEIPIIKDRNPDAPQDTEKSPAFPMNVGQIPKVAPPELPQRQYQISSNPGATQVAQPAATGVVPDRRGPFKNASVSRSRGDHTIQIIPATKHTGQQEKELIFPGDQPSPLPKPSKPPTQLPVQGTALQTTSGSVAETSPFTPATNSSETTPIEKTSAEPMPMSPEKLATQVVKPVVARRPVPSDTPAEITGPPQRLLPKELIELTGYAKQPSEHVAAIAKHLTHYSPRVRAVSAFLLGRAGTSAVGQIPQLEAALKSEKHGPARIRIAESLVRLAPDHPVALKSLEDGLQSEQRDIRWEAVCVADVVAKHEKRSAVLALLLERLHDIHADIRTMAALKLGEFRNDDALVIGPLEEALNQSGNDDSLRKAAAVSLAVLRPTGQLEGIEVGR